MEKCPAVPMKPQELQAMNFFSHRKKSSVWLYAAGVGVLWILIWFLDWIRAPVLDPDFRTQNISVFLLPDVSLSAPKKYFTLEPLA